MHYNLGCDKTLGYLNSIAAHTGEASGTRRKQLKWTQTMKSHRVSHILLLGILGLVLVIPAPLAWYLGEVDLAEMHSGTMDPSGKRSTYLGRFMGMSVTVLVGFMLFLVCVVTVWQAFMA
ncbi:MAG: hypothetical protein COA78_04155 [Blastopirellula sp.]|nr:MAG: hypothetical protein COA78_04155 [Blastopirellula sp.]